jgi:hypothetical protein
MEVAQQRRKYGLSLLEACRHNSIDEVIEKVKGTPNDK